MRLYGYFRSSASWRVRIALNLKGLQADLVPRHLRRGEQRDPGYLALNPQGLVPALLPEDGPAHDGPAHDGPVLTQSLAIIEWLEEHYPEPALLPSDPGRRARVRAFALAIACDIHPIQNLKVLARLRHLGVAEEDVGGWAKWVIEEGFAALETMIADEPGPFAFGDAPTLADVCLVPQFGNARRFGVDVERFPRLLAAERAALELPAFTAALPEEQPDAE
ncbi:maleylacetoacetate isomerase [Azospirillum soli]|uniref:maleylacetoacetate isomerase n=1 Tax=Azospirillum soli TaxID=1304799 RepID=UPI001AE3FDD4|nr:maleylpyruvate isomerase [Azospirillum soli]